jgi:tetratricopeptide (TPR) repeat protein
MTAHIVHDQLVALGVANSADADALDAWMNALAASRPASAADDAPPQPAEVCYDAGLAALATDEPAMAADLFLDAAWQRPMFAEAWHNLGAAWRMLNREQDARWALSLALWLYERAADADPEDPYPWYWAAAALTQLGQHELALERLTEAVALAPEYAAEAAEEPDFSPVAQMAGFKAILRLAGRTGEKKERS